MPIAPNSINDLVCTTFSESASGGDGPAMVHPSYEKWYRYGLRHRADGPATIRFCRAGIILIDPPQIEWWFKGIQFNNVTDWGKSNPIDPDVFTLLKLQYG